VATDKQNQRWRELLGRDYRKKEAQACCADVCFGCRKRWRIVVFRSRFTGARTREHQLPDGLSQRCFAEVIRKRWWKEYAVEL
jgi:hypothetical protein